MSGIFGLIGLRGQPADAELRLMEAAMAYWGPDGRDVWTGGPAGLGHLKLLATPEAARERLPFRDPESGLVFTASARLDDRQELCRSLNVPLTDQETTPDTLLLFRAWLRWGESALARLGGDWSFALWDPREQRLVLARDPSGQTALYYAATTNEFAFASCQKALLALPDLARDPDDLRLAQVLTSWPGDGATTAYQAIRRIPSAHILVWRDGKAQIRRYWNMEDAPDVRLPSDDAYVEAFLERYSRAVRTRLRNVRPLASTLSAGLDSGSVTALAARELQMRSSTLTAFTSVPLCPPDGAGRDRLGNEWPLAHMVAERWPSIVHVPVSAAEITPLQGIEHQLRIMDEPTHAACNFFWICALMQSARDLGIGVLLTGQLGNGTVSWAGRQNRAWNLLVSGHPASAARELSAWKRERGRSWRAAIRSQILHPLVSPWRDRLGRAFHPSSAEWEAYSAIQPAFARRMRLGELMRAAGHDPGFHPQSDPRAARISLLDPGLSIVGSLWHEVGAAYGMEVRDPTGDRQLLEFCLGVPDDQFGRLGKGRWLIRRAMKGLLPREVCWNRRQGAQAADLGHRLVADGDHCQQWLNDLEESAACRERVDVPRLRRVFHSLQSRVDPESTNQAISILTRGLDVGRFLVQGSDSSQHAS